MSVWLCFWLVVVKTADWKTMAIAGTVIALIVGAGAGYLIGGFQTNADYEARIAQLEQEIIDLGGVVPEPKPTIRFTRAQTSVNFIDYSREKQFRIMEAMGYTVDVQYVDVTPSIAALIAGEVDFIGTTAMEYLPAIEAGEDIIQICPTNTRGYLLVTSDDINSIADLEGRIIGASSYTSISYLYMKYILLDNGVDPASVTWSMVGGSSARNAALAAGSIDAGLLYAEYALVLDTLPGLHILGSLPEFSDTGEVTSGVAVRKDFMDQYPQATANFVKAGLLANIFALTQRDAYIAEGMAWVEEETSAGNNISYYTQLYDGYLSWGVWDLEFNAAMADRAVELAIDAGSITTSLAASTWNDFSLWTSALQEYYQA
ncbi:MAG: ABC transporter substrate-binding protein [Candidatus Thorarchaeota archaeon]